MPFAAALTLTGMLTLNATAQAQASAPPAAPQPSNPAAADAQLPAAPTAQPGASVSGTIVDPGGAAIAGATVSLSMQLGTLPSATPPVLREVHTDASGAYSFTALPEGPFELHMEAKGFAKEELRGVLGQDEVYTVPEQKLQLAGTQIDVVVTFTSHELAQQQIDAQVHQRVFGAIPNFYVSYVQDPEPLSTGQKFQLAFKTVIDPVSIVIAAGTAGVQQADNSFEGYGQGAAGYGKRFGAQYADLVTGTFIGGAVLPSLLKQDPRYFYQGTGSIRSRAWHAIERSVICESDSHHKQFDYSGILGGLASAGLSNLYYPDSDRNGAGLTFRNLGIGIAAGAAQNLFQEFLVRKLSTGTRPAAAQTATPAATPTTAQTATPATAQAATQTAP